jgi:hypothetical protein
MQVILMEKVANLGELGDVVKVKDGFARNFLIPHGKAKRATEANLKAFESRRTELEKAQAETLQKAQERGAKLDGLTLQISRMCACPRGRSSRWATSRSRSRCTPTSRSRSPSRCSASSNRSVFLCSKKGPQRALFFSATALACQEN